MRKRSNIVKVRAYCFQARDLPAADEGGSSDPFLRITDCARHHDTKTIFDNVNPIYYETMDMGYEANTIDDLPPIVIDLYDMDVNTITKNSIDFLSRAVLYPEDIEPYSTGNGVPTPKWYPLHYKRGGPTAGEVLMSFAIVEDDFKFNTPSHLVNLPKEAGIVMREYNVMMNILGLRSLMSAGILPVKKAFINFNLKSMVSPEQGEAIENIKTEPSAPGADPTLNTLIEFDIRLPTERLYCPRMSCQVFDSVMMGFSQPLIGNFTIPIGDLIFELAEERSREIEALEEVVAQLDKYAKGELLAISFREKFKTKDNALGALMRSNTKDVMTESAKARDKKVIAIPEGGKQDFSLNGEGDEDKPLLEGDADDELKQSQRLMDSMLHATDGAKRMSPTQVQAIADLKQMRVTG